MENEKRLIDANAFLKALNERSYDFLDVGGDFGYFDETIDSVMNEQPTVDAVEVVHGRWEQKEFWTDGGTWRCSECGRQIMFMKGTPITEHMYYCPNCGAKMDGDGNVGNE